MTAGGSEAQHRPNILYLHSHDTGRYIQPYGHAIPTPRLQRLAEEGVLFRQCFAGGPTCSPSRAALLTGTYPHSCGQFGLVNCGFELERRDWHLAGFLRDAGYFTAVTGVHHCVRDPSTTGYDFVAADTGLSTPAAVALPQALDLIRSALRPPFFLDVGFWETHRTRGAFHAPDPAAHSAEDSRYCLPPPPIPDTPQTRRDMAGFKASARVLDQSMGAVLDALAAQGLLDDTLVICTTDHGIAFPSMKCNLTDHGLGVMLIVRSPRGSGDFVGGKVVDAMVSQTDVFPTLCDVLGIEPPAWLQGASLLPLVRGSVEQIHDAIFGEVTYHTAYEPMRSVRTSRWKYIRRFSEYGKPMLCNCDEGESKALWLEHGWPERPVAAEALYDLVFDPVETNNLAEDPACAGPLAELRSHLDRWMRETDDPLLRGPIPAPPGAVVNDPADILPGAEHRRRRDRQLPVTAPEPAAPKL